MNELTPKFTKEIVKGRQTANNIALQLKRAITESKSSANIIKNKFRGKNDFLTCFKIWDFCKKNIHYKRESENLQTAKTLPLILFHKYGDCKHYTTFCVSLLQAIGIPCKMRLISQNYYNSEPTHIYCVATIQGKEIILDACMNSFNNECGYKYKYDLKIN